MNNIIDVSLLNTSTFPLKKRERHLYVSDIYEYILSNNLLYSNTKMNNLFFYYKNLTKGVK
jgi:hypothetical protein